MRNNFYPAKPFMLREIEKCIEAGNLDTLIVFCKSCVFHLCIKSNEPACRNCIIKHGISRSKDNSIINARKKNDEIISGAMDVLNTDAHC
jgi:hypothetical protein